ncbi:hypothetical protein T08_11039 [Trichinella sp. T8]|nr:hypothetical protein T08_11039 [Trichinella sp. T8]
METDRSLSRVVITNFQIHQIHCRLTTPSTPHHLNLNCSTKLKLVDSIIQNLLQFIYHCINFLLENFSFHYSSCCSFLSLWKPFLVLLFTSVCFKYGMTNIVRYINCTHFIHDSLTGEYDVSSDGIFS